MKVYVVMCLDTNNASFVDRVFLREEDAAGYVREANRRDSALAYYYTEQILWGHGESPVTYDAGQVYGALSSC
ncbi:MAG TPA: hypothetical protein GXZ65_05545 [Clostridiales bacterium]|jgi:hypothetical protein|nr:hypothetical protein [Clostridiales bacterium]